MQRRGFSLPETLIIGAIVVLLAVIGTGIISLERARLRDAKRMIDITRIAGSFAVLYAQHGGYEQAATGCTKVGVKASSCTLPGIATSGNDLTDPGSFSYTVSRVPDHQDFGITFQLERGYGTLAAGKHVLTKQGVR
jgi:type II secretory pathway pseudopilin PulG